MSELIDSIERRQLRRELPAFRMGDRVRVHFQVIEGNRRRTQVFEGIVIRRQGSGARRTFTVRKISFGVGVERTFPLHSPKIERLEIVARGQVRRARLYYLRGRVGRRARVRERRHLTPEELAPAAVSTPEPEQVEASADGGQPEDGAAEAAEAVAAAEGSEPEAATGAGDQEHAESEAKEPQGDGGEAELPEQQEPEGAEQGQPAQSPDDREEEA